MRKEISALLGMMIGVATGGIAVGVKSSGNITKRREFEKKLHELYTAMDQWLQIRQQGHTLVEYFEKNQYKTIAVYGMKELGERLCDELRDTDVTVSYAIDQDAESIYADIDVVTPNEELAPVDVIVVTAITFFDEIEENLAEKVDCPIISLEDILYEM